jgi:para-aminobenzoate synthetase component 1
LAAELLESEKERAEHLMLVDLERNDLGRVSAFGTVQVPRFMEIERYSHVIHLVSDVTGILREDANPIDALRATFPGGTITGAPKIRAMEIIEEIEPVRRGIYTGSVGWIDFRGDLAMNIAIRTAVLEGTTAIIQAGAGIVADSVPSHEYRESLRKAEALLVLVQEATA